MAKKENYFHEKSSRQIDFETLLERYAKRTEIYLPWNKLTYDEYTNYLMGRELIQKIIDTRSVSDERILALKLIDEELKNNTIEIDFPLYQTENTDKKRYWFLYRIIPNKFDDWKIYFQRESHV